MGSLRLNREQIDRMAPEARQELLLKMRQLDLSKRTRAIEHYQPLPGGQTAFHRSLAQIRAILGGNRGGKTVAGAVEGIRYMRGRHPIRPVVAPNHGWIVCEDLDVARDVILPILFEYFPKDEIAEFNKALMILRHRNGSWVKFKSAESDPRKFESAECRWIWFDEEPPKEIYDACLNRTGAGGPLDVWITMTPLEGMDWSYDEIYSVQKPGKVECFILNTLQNTHLLESERERLKDKWEGTPEGAARLHGHYFERSGRIYKSFHPDLHVIEPFDIPNHWPVALAIDPHPAKACAAVWVAISPENVFYVFQELNDDYELLAYFADAVMERSLNHRIVRRLIDPSSLQEHKGKGRNIKDELGGRGLTTILANNRISYGWDSVRERLENQFGIRIFFFRTVSKTIWQMEHLIYERFKPGKEPDQPKQVKRRDDLADCVRYLCAEKLVWEPGTLDDEPLPAGNPYTGY